MIKHWCLVLTVSAIAINAQPRSLWQHHGVHVNTGRVAVSPSGQTLAYSTHQDQRYVVTIVHRGGDPFSIETPTTSFAQFVHDDTVLVVSSYQNIYRVHVPTKSIVVDHTWNWDTVFRDVYRMSDPIVSPDGRRCIVTANQGFSDYEYQCAVMDLTTMSVVQFFTLDDHKRKVRFGSERNSLLFYDGDEIIVDEQTRLPLLNSKYITDIAVFGDTCWVAHHDVAEDGLWISKVSLDPLTLVLQRRVSTDYEPSGGIEYIARLNVVVAEATDGLMIVDASSLNPRDEIEDISDVGHLSYSTVDIVGRTKDRYLVSMTDSFQPNDTVLAPITLTRSLTQDRSGVLFAAQDSLRTIDVWLGTEQRVNLGVPTSHQLTSLSYIAADPNSDLFAAKTHGDLHLYSGEHRDSLVMRINIDRGPGNILFHQEPFQVLQFDANRSSIVTLGWYQYGSTHRSEIQRYPISLEPDSPHPKGITSVVTPYRDQVQGVSNGEYDRFVLCGRDAGDQVVLIGDTTTSIPTATSATYQSTMGVFILDHPRGLQYVSGSTLSVIDSIDLGERLLPLCAASNNTYILGWLTGSSVLALYDINKRAITWRSEHRVRPLTSIIDRDGAWFVVSFPHGMLEAYATGTVSSVSNSVSVPDVRLYPQPGKDQVVIASPMAIDVWTVYDLSGQVIHSGSGTVIPTASFSTGLYIVIATSATNTVRLPMIVQR